MASIAEPPYERNGSGSPMTGSIPVTMPMLIKMWIRYTPTAPAATMLPKGCFTSAPSLMSRRRRAASRPRTSSDPMRPNSSAITLKMKSVVCSGT